MSYIGNQPKAKLWGYTPQSAAPTNPREGDVYNDDGTVQAIAGLYLYQGSTWKLLRMVGTVDTTDLVDGAVTPDKLSTGHPEWDSSSNFKMDSGYGSNEIAYGVRAWVRFNGTNTVTIVESGNVSSITDNGTGDYNINFSTSLPDTNYGIVGSHNQTSNAINGFMISNTGNTSSSAHIQTSANVALVDPELVSVIVVR